MLNEENELLSRVGPGTPMGRFMRRFWVPVLPSFKLIVDSPPERVKLLGEKLVAFRTSDGRVGVFDEGCPHRGVSLALARNAECALTCIFHGWKFDVSGKVLDVPPEPAERRAAFAERVKVRAYPTHEAAGMVFAWMGEGTPAPFPAFNWTTLPESHVYVTAGIVGASWLSGLEGQLDSAHVGILHSDWVSRGADFGKNNIDRTTHDLAPRFEFVDERYGYREAAVRRMPDGTHYVRVREYVMPWYSYIPQQGGRAAPQLLTISVPMDDETSMQWDVRYTLDSPIDMSRILGVQTSPFMDARAEMGGIGGRFGQDRAKVSAGAWTGFPSVRHEDYAVSMAQGAIPNREREHLSISDLSVVRARRILRQAVQEHAGGAQHVSDDASVDWSLVRSFAEIIPAEMDWRALPRG